MRGQAQLTTLVVSGALTALTAAILWLGSKVTDVSERLTRVETQVLMLRQQSRGITGPYDDLDKR